LRHLRRKDEPRTLWVDAPCINQDDTLEREEQVQRMEDIYRLDYRVIVWLGTEEDESSLALLTLGHLGAQVEVAMDGLKLPFPKAEQNTWFDESFDSPYDPTAWKAISRLCYDASFRGFGSSNRLRLPIV
jgi:hypothetical protein